MALDNATVTAASMTLAMSMGLGGVSKSDIKAAHMAVASYMDWGDSVANGDDDVLPSKFEDPANWKQARAVLAKLEEFLNNLLGADNGGRASSSSIVSQGTAQFGRPVTQTNVSGAETTDVVTATKHVWVSRTPATPVAVAAPSSPAPSQVSSMRLQRTQSVVQAQNQPVAQPQPQPQAMRALVQPQPQPQVRPQARAQVNVEAITDKVTRTLIDLRSLGITKADKQAILNCITVSGDNGQATMESIFRGTGSRRLVAGTQLINALHNAIEMYGYEVSQRTADIMNVPNRRQTDKYEYDALLAEFMAFAFSG
jgi:hypothetical protein